MLITAALAGDVNIQSTYDPEKNLTRVETPTVMVTTTAGGGPKGSGLWFFYACPGKLSRCAPDGVSVAVLTIASPQALKYKDSDKSIQFVIGSGAPITVTQAKNGTTPGSDQSYVVERLWGTMSVLDFKRLAAAASVSGIAGGTVRFTIPEESQNLLRKFSASISDK